ncbi:MAG: hypothetical protein Q7T59_01070 [Candidatus Woesebacteria bacterium]|nr:hypothetical protein [Candidatus Woesebacteria bacterium]
MPKVWSGVNGTSLEQTNRGLWYNTDMAEFKELSPIVESIMKPGNLVWGVNRIDENNFKSILNRGILPGNYFGKMSIRPGYVCFSMLQNDFDKTDGMRTYEVASHKGPKSDNYYFQPNDKYFDLAIVVDKDKILKSFPNRVLAIGDYFHKNGLLICFDMKTNDKHVYDVPVGYCDAYSEEPWLDEVVVKFDRKQIEDNKNGITPDLWSGLVVNEKYFESLKKWLDNSNTPNMPIISPEGKILTI